MTLLTLRRERRGDDLRDVAAALSRIDDFVAVRDVPALTRRHLADVLGEESADLLVLFGACPPGAWDGVARAVASGVARDLLLVGGIGHTTPVLWRAMAGRYPDAQGLPEATLMARYLADEHGLYDVLVEELSTDCGSNIARAAEVVRRAGLRPRSVVLVQDRTMQRRMLAGFEHLWPVGPDGGLPRALGFAGYEQRFVVREGGIGLALPDLWGGWTAGHHASLLLGEVARLHDTPTGYGPRGHGFIAHVDVPADVLAAADLVAESLGVAPRATGQGAPAAPGSPSISSS
ncbi:ElyC/SanA/YdcF family protein [Nocardioides sp. GCM10027113]|uniref:ElyC/SanA/YdcF family protein n=1 Tax=unclassified Nocardioides TaxID=2615069 RepID=UPI0036196313